MLAITTSYFVDWVQVFLSEPGQTGYDMQFSLFGFPVRVHPLFFLAPLLFGQGLVSGMPNVGLALLVVTFVFFVSILFHELGHAWAFKWFGIGSRIVLHWMGGLAIPDRGSWGSRQVSLTPNQQIIVSVAGPLANVVLAFAILGIGLALKGGFAVRNIPIPLPVVIFEGTALGGKPYLHLFFNATIVLNLLWAIFNMVPVFPLDGGQVARALMQKIDPRDGLKNSLYLSIGVAGLLCFYAFSIKSTFLAIFCGYMAYESWQSLQRLSGRGW